MEKKSKLSRLITKLGSVRLSQIWDIFKKPFNFCWKAGLIIVALVCVVAIGDLLIDECKSALGLEHYYWQDEPLANDIEVRHYSDGMVAAYDLKTDKRMSPMVKWISGVPCRDSLTVFCDKNDKRGFLNVNTGKVVIDGQYSHAWHFSEGLAAVVSDNGKIGFINYDNEMVIPAEYDYVEESEYLFKDGMCVIRDAQTMKYGVIDREGNLRLPMDYSMIFKNDGQDSWYIRKNGKVGLTDSHMNIIFEPIYTNISVSGCKDSAYVTLDGVKQLVSFDGEVIIPFVIDEAWALTYRGSDDEGCDVSLTHPYLVEVLVDYGCHGVMDTRTGKMIVPAVYSDITMISKDIMMAEIDHNEENNIVFTSSGQMVK